MIEFKIVENTKLVTDHSLLVTSILKLFDYCDRSGGIDLTPSKAFKRKFVNWAANEFNWPGYTYEYLSVVNRVFNEMDFPPLSFIHQLLLDLKMGRHYKGQFKLTKSGQALISAPSKLFGIITPFFLFEYEHGVFRRPEEKFPGNWDIFLNVINLEARYPISGQELVSKLFGNLDGSDAFALSRRVSVLYVSVLRPLCWAGLLREMPIANDASLDRLFQKTPLWKASLRLETDALLERTSEH